MDIGIVNNLKQGGSQYLGNIAGQIGQINWTSPSWDLFIFMFFLGAVVLFMFSLSRERILTTLLGTYVALAVMKGVGSLSKFFLLSNKAWFLPIIIFLVILIIVTALLSRLNIGSSSGLPNLWQVLYFSILQTGLLIVVIMLFLPVEISSHFHPLTREIFVNNISQIVWFLFPLLSLIFIRKK